MIRALCAVIHHEEPVFVQVIHLSLISLHVAIMEFLIFLLVVTLKGIPESSTLFHGIWMSAVVSLLDLVNVLCSIEEIR